MDPLQEPVTYTIRRATMADCESLLALLPQLSSRPDAHQASTPTTRRAQTILQRLLTNDFVHLFVAEEAGQAQTSHKLLGTVIMIIVPNLTHDGLPWAQIENVVVAGSMRRKGVGRALLEAAVACAGDHNCYKVQLISGTKPEQLAFYKALGFVTDICTGHKLYLR